MLDIGGNRHCFWTRCVITTVFLFLVFGANSSAAAVNCGLGQSCPDEHQCCRVGISVWCCPTAVRCDYDIDEDWTIFRIWLGACSGSLRLSGEPSPTQRSAEPLSDLICASAASSSSV